MAQLLRVDGTITPVTLPTNQQAALAELQRLVGGYIEMVKLTTEDPRGRWLVLFVDEDGQRNGRVENLLATQLLPEGMNLGWPLLGDAVLCTVSNPGQEDERVE